MFSPFFTNMKAFVVMCLLFVSCFADDYLNTNPENVKSDDGGHDSGEEEPGDLLQLLRVLYGGFGGGFGR